MKKSRDKQDLINSIIPLGMIFGTCIGVFIGIFLKPDIVLYTLPAGSALGLLLGTVIFAIYYKDENL